ncbi:MAG: acyl-CoA thioesterase II [Pseudomonadota bacterium]
MIKVAELMALEQIEDNLFRGQNEEHGGPRLFGGQVLGQALMAAALTVDKSQRVHSLHGYFMRPGRFDHPVVLDVERIRDGRSFSTRRVVAIQQGEAIFNVDVSCQILEDGFEHQMEAPDVAPPEEIEDDRAFHRRLAETHDDIPEWAMRERPIEIRSVVKQYDPDLPKGMKPAKHMWLKTVESLPDDPTMHRCILAYASDMGLMSTGILPHRGTELDVTIQGASLDHAMWFHRDFRIDDWLLYATESPAAAAARGFNRGSFYTRDGILVASTIQEGLMRPHKEAV